MPGPATKATATIKQSHSVCVSLSRALGQKEANQRVDTNCDVSQVYLTPCREQIHTKQRGKKSSQGRANTCCNYKNLNLNDSARDRQRQRGKERQTNVIAKWHNAQKMLALKRKVPLTGKSR